MLLPLYIDSFKTLLRLYNNIMTTGVFGLPLRSCKYPILINSK